MKIKYTGVNQSECKKIIFNDDGYIISDIVNHICLSSGKQAIYAQNAKSKFLQGILPGIAVKDHNELSQQVKEGLCYLEIESEIEYEELQESGMLKDCCNDYIIYCKTVSRKAKIDNLYPLDRISSLEGGVILIGKTFSFHERKIPEDFSVIAIVHCYNEADIIGTTINYLLNQGIDVYLIDNWSDDGTEEIINDFVVRFPDRIKFEKFPLNGKNDYCDLYHQLERTEQLAVSEKYNWFMHYDADEIHVSPWSGTTLREAIYQIDRLGYTTIDNTVIDFKLTQSNMDENIFAKDTYFDYGHRSAHFRQRKTWKKCEEIELKSSGGHMARVPGNRTFPLNILNRHYPLRSLEQAERKIFRDRKPRFEKEQQERGWHGHYNSIQSKNELMNDAKHLLLWDLETYHKYYVASFLTCGIKRAVRTDLLKLDRLANKKIAIYGAGVIGTEVFLYLYRLCEIAIWVDRDWDKVGNRFFTKIDSVEKLSEEEFDICVIANAKSEIQQSIVNYLMEIGLDKEKIIVFP